MGRWARVLLAGSGGLLAAATAQAPRDALADVEPGRWRLHEIGVKGPDRELCVADPRLFLQLGHGEASCARVTLPAGANRSSARYSCPGAGYGQTVVTVEGPHLLRIQTQGLAGGAPFQADYEARHAGPCR